MSAIAERLFAVERTPPAPRTILVVDDEEGIRKYIGRVLQGAGYTTVVAANGPEALRVAAALPTLDLVVTDVMMPAMSGCELARRLRQDNPDLRVLYVTGYSDRLFDEKVMMWEEEAFIEKPCSMKAVLEAVSLLWSQHIDTPVVRQSCQQDGDAARLAS
jgi:two-component system cell cycle sensor histidine kinase/response regulator CckA